MISAPGPVVHSVNDVFTAMRDLRDCVGRACLRGSAEHEAVLQLFDVVLRGYRRRQVDEYLKRLKSDPATVNEQPLFGVVFRGYDRIQVSEYLHSLGCQPPP